MTGSSSMNIEKNIRVNGNRFLNVCGGDRGGVAFFTFVLAFIFAVCMFSEFIQEVAGDFIPTRLMVGNTNNFDGGLGEINICKDFNESLSLGELNSTEVAELADKMKEGDKIGTLTLAKLEDQTKEEGEKYNKVKEKLLKLVNKGCNDYFTLNVKSTYCDSVIGACSECAKINKVIRNRTNKVLPEACDCDGKEKQSKKQACRESKKQSKHACRTQCKEKKGAFTERLKKENLKLSNFKMCATALWKKMLNKHLENTITNTTRLTKLKTDMTALINGQAYKSCEEIAQSEPSSSPASAPSNQ